MKKYRPNVGIVVYNKNKKVLMCRRADKNYPAWQFPQGGIDKNEEVIEAAKRELSEETGIEKVKFISKTDKPLRYDFPPQVIKYQRKQGYDWDGQEQIWVLFEFEGENKDINFLTHPEEIEFTDFAWVDIDEAPQKIVEFKREVYKKVVAKFKPFLA